MKKLTIIALFCVVSISAHSIGRPHNIFKTYKMVSVKSDRQSSRLLTPDLSTIEKSKETVLKNFSLVQKIGKIIENFIR